MRDYASRTLEELVDDILADASRMPVRRMEAVLLRGEEAVEPVLSGLRRALDAGDPMKPLWPVVLLGELGSPEAAPALADVLLAAEPDDLVLPQAAASRLAGRYGDPDGDLSAPGRPAASSDVGRNDPCPCGSGEKYKKCCGDPTRRTGGGPRSGRPHLETFDGETVSIARAHYRVTDPDAAREALVRSPELEPEPGGDAFVWAGERDGEVRRVLDRHYREWPDEPVPALGGRTPREAAEEGAGRERVAALIRSFEEMEETKPPGQRYDFGWPWKELGLDDLRGS